MTKVALNQLPCALQIRGRIGRLKPPAERGQYGVAVAGVAGYGDDGTAGLPVGVGIYQMRHCTNGYVPVKMKLYDQVYTTSEELQANRNKFREAMDLWKTLTIQQKAVYFKKVEHLKMHAHNYFVKEYLRNH